MKRGQIVAVCGPPGAGKSELLPYLVDQLVPWIVVDLDEILEPDGTLLGVQVGGSAGEANWAAYEALWSRIFDMMTRSGHSVVVLSQIPSVEGLSNPASPVTRWILLDCPDEVRRQRLLRRGWSEDRIAECVDFAAQGRRLIREAVTTTPTETPAETAEKVRSKLAS